ncbi:DUF3810 family protein [Empedobacter sp.]|uniref:DUF3810 family protein n=1 Tax=Empedobacter sp. TaxID=1927715 RepID=UPI0028AD0170|nr:DUF3810 family protein [Empedobacter sp.]
MLKKLNKTYRSILIFLFQIILFSVLFSIESVDDFIVNHLTFPISGFITRITNSVHFPVGELFYLIIGIIGFVLIFKLIRSFFKSKEKVSHSIYYIMIFVNCIYFIYTFAWGVMYKKETLTIDKEKIVIQPKILKKIYCYELDKAISARNLIEHNDSTTTIKFKSDLEEYNQEFFALQSQVKNIKWLKNYRLLNDTHYKLSWISEMQNYMGILGYYNPFTVEANLNRYNTNLKQPATLFHEYGHQMGFASESEANFLAYYLGTKSKNPEINYSVYYKSIYTLLGAIYKSDPYFVKMELDNMHSKIKQDRKAELKHYLKYEGATSDTFSELNNQFLKANNQEGTISNSKYVELIYLLYQTKKATN